MAKTWKQKLKDSIGKEPKITILNKAMSGVAKGGKLLLPTPEMIKEFIERIPSGQQVGFDQMRKQIAHSNQADISCPLASSSAFRIVAEAAWEEIQEGKSSDEVVPFWRVLDPFSKVAQKLTCGSGFVESIRQEEGCASSQK